MFYLFRIYERIYIFVLIGESHLRPVPVWRSVSLFPAILSGCQTQRRGGPAVPPPPGPHHGGGRPRGPLSPPSGGKNAKQIKRTVRDVPPSPPMEVVTTSFLCLMGKILQLDGDKRRNCVKTIADDYGADKSSAVLHFYVFSLVYVCFCWYL